MKGRKLKEMSHQLWVSEQFVVLITLTWIIWLTLWRGAAESDNRVKSTHNSTNSTGPWTPRWLESVKWLLQWDTTTRLTGSQAVCVAMPAVHLLPELGPHHRLMKPHSHRYFRMPFSLFWVQICTLANHPQQHLRWSFPSPELSLDTACLGSAIMQCQICSASNLYPHINHKPTNHI